MANDLCFSFQRTLKMGAEMKKSFFLVLFVSAFLIFPSLSSAGELPKIAVWDLVAGNITPAYAQDLTSILVSEITKFRKYEVYSQENVRTLAGWTAERMTLGCTDSKCLTALGQMDNMLGTRTTRVLRRIQWGRSGPTN
jgi:hypothetical protein